MDKSILAERLRYARATLRNVSMHTVAELSGVAASTVQRYETGQINKIKLPVVEAFARALCVNRAWLMGEDVPMESPAPVRNLNMVSDITHLLSLTDTTLTDADLNGNFRLKHGDENLIITMEDMDAIINQTKEFALCALFERSFGHKKTRLVINAENALTP